MSRKVLRASCSTLNPSTGQYDWVNFLEHTTTTYDPARLTVFVGERAPSAQYSALASTGGLSARQLFRWENFPTKDLSRYFIDFSEATVTLRMTLLPKVGTSAGLTDTFTGQLPSDSMAINLNSTFGQGAADNMLNEDVWGRLAYYDTGALGQGIVFSPADYVPQGTADGRGLFMNGALIPDYNDGEINLLTENLTATRRTPSANFQMGRDASLISQGVLGNIQGISGYWSLGVEPVASNVTGNICGSISQLATAEVSNLTPWMHFGTPTVGYPSIAETDGTTDSQKNYWQAVNPMYGRSATGGAMRCGNCLAIAPSTFMTDFGFGLLTNENSNPQGASTPENQRWTTYFTQAGTNLITLSETQPLGLTTPIASGPMPFEAVPNIQSGLYMLVPVTRVLNGVTLYTPYNGTATTSQGAPNNEFVTPFHGVTNDASQGAAKGFWRPPGGLMYAWYEVREVCMTINVPAYRIDSVQELNTFFGLLTFNPTLTREASLWLKWSLADNNPLSSTISVLALNSQQTNGDRIEFNISARDILQKVTKVFEMYGIQQARTEWPTNTLSIHQVLATCTTKADLFQQYKELYASSTYLTSAAGTLMSNGGCRTFTRCGPNLSAGAPTNMTVTLYDIVNGLGEVVSATAKRFTELDAIPCVSNSRFRQVNDFLTSCPTLIAGAAPQLRIPNLNVSTDMGGLLSVAFNTQAIVNLPWAGPMSQSWAGGGPELTGFAASTLINADKLKSYSKGWFNNLNPWSPDYTKGSITNGTDKWPDLDSRVVNFNARAVEVWVQIGVEIPVYNQVPTGTNTTADDGVSLTGYSAPQRAAGPSAASAPRSVSRSGLPVARVSIPM